MEEIERCPVHIVSNRHCKACLREALDKAHQVFAAECTSLGRTITTQISKIQDLENRVAQLDRVVDQLIKHSTRIGAGIGDAITMVRDGSDDGIVAAFLKSLLMPSHFDASRPYGIPVGSPDDTTKMHSFHHDTRPSFLAGKSTRIKQVFSDEECLYLIVENFNG